MRERWIPLLKTNGNIYQKGEKTLIVSEKEFTLQTKDKIFKRKRPIIEKEPRTENKLPLCGGCQKLININNPNVGYLRYRGELFHNNCLKFKDRTPQAIIFREPYDEPKTHK